MMMTTRRLLLTSALLAGAGWLLPAHGADSPLPPEAPLPRGARLVTPAEAAPLVQSGAVSVLDIRTAPEVTSEGRLSGSKHLDFFREDFDKVLISELNLPLEKPCLIYCAIGGRSRQAAQRLAGLGFKQVLVLKDGFNGWKKAGLPVEKLK